MKLCLEASLAFYIPVDHALIPWLLEHTCLILNTTAVGPDGRTARTRVRGRKFSQRLLKFGEQVLYKLPVKGPLSAPDGNMGTRWREGAYLGHCPTSNVYTIGTSTGIVEARSLQRRPESDRWNAEQLASIKATPWSLREIAETTVTFQERAGHIGPSSLTAAPAAARRLRINQNDLDAHGYTDQCPQCDYIRRFSKPRPGHTHTMTGAERD